MSIKEQYLSKLKGDEKRCFRFLQLDQTQSMTCKIDAPKRCGSDDHFIDKLLKMFEGSYEYVTAKAEENCRGDEGTGGWICKDYRWTYSPASENTLYILITKSYSYIPIASYNILYLYMQM